MHPLDWSDMHIRLRTAENKVRRLTVEVEALRELIVEQALEIQRLHHVTTLPVECTGNGTPAMAANDEGP
jgi:hypothetical protein